MASRPGGLAGHGAYITVGGIPPGPGPMGGMSGPMGPGSGMSGSGAGYSGPGAGGGEIGPGTGFSGPGAGPGAGEGLGGWISGVSDMADPLFPGSTPQPGCCWPST